MSQDDHENSTATPPFLWAVEQARARDLSQAELVVLALLAHVDGDNERTIADLALCGRMSDRKVTAALRRLEFEGLVITDRRQRLPSLYHINRNAAPAFRWAWETDEVAP